MSDKQNTLIVFNRNGMGEAEQDLQHRLAKTYLRMWLDGDAPLPAAICFYAEGVLRAVDDSPVLDELKALDAAGVYLILCSTCVDTFGVRERLAVGIVGGMHDILEAQQRADRVITL